MNGSHASSRQGLIECKMHHQELQEGHRAQQTTLMMQCVTPTMSRCHMESCMVCSAGVDRAGHLLQPRLVCATAPLALQHLHLRARRAAAMSGRTVWLDACRHELMDSALPIRASSRGSMPLCALPQQEVASWTAARNTAWTVSPLCPRNACKTPLQSSAWPPAHIWALLEMRRNCSHQ